MEEYNELVEQYELLIEEEKRACLIYKSRLSFLINEITAVPNFLDLNADAIYHNLNNPQQFLEIYLKYKKILEKPNNFFMKLSIMNSLKFDTIQSIIDSLKQVYVTNINMVTNQDIKLYRMVSTKEPNHSISKSNLVSTSIDVDCVEKFMIYPYNQLYQIDLEAGSKVLVIPYRILLDSKDNSLKITKDDFSQKEVVIFKDELILEEKSTKEYEDNLTVYKVVAKNKKIKHL